MRRRRSRGQHQQGRRRSAASWSPIAVAQTGRSPAGKLEEQEEEPGCGLAGRGGQRDRGRTSERKTGGRQKTAPSEGYHSNYNHCSPGPGTLGMLVRSSSADSQIRTIPNVLTCACEAGD